MKFFKQINNEINYILESKFILIIAILVLAYSIVPPVIGAIIPSFNQNNDIYSKSFGEGAIDYSYTDIYYDDVVEDNGSTEPIIVNGESIDPENPLHWYINYSMEDKLYAQSDVELLSDSVTKQMVLDIYDIQIDYFVNASKNVLRQDDYRYELVWSYAKYPIEKYIYEHNTVNPEALKNAAEYRWVYEEDFNKKFIEITPDKRDAEIAGIDRILKKYNEILESRDESGFLKYIELKIDKQKNNIISLEQQIAILEQSKKEDPEQTENINNIIDIVKRDAEMIKTDTIPILEYRLKKNVVPYIDSWQNRAIYDIEQNQLYITHIELVTKEEFRRDQDLISKHKTYDNYVNFQNDQINKYNNNILIAKNSLYSGKPDMKYVYSGARQQTVNFLNFSIIVAMFSVLLGGWLIASEYQQGTIRPLMITPKRRTKILMSKFFAALIICILIYTAGSVLNLIANGICFGFYDFAYPNYTVSGPISFFAEYIPNFFVCIVPIIFAFCIAFMLSVIIKNTAVSVIIPAVCYVACFIAMDMNNISNNHRFTEFLRFTPIPYIDISAFFMQNSAVRYMIEDLGIPLSIPVGAAMLLAIAGISVVVSALVFKKQDIAS